MRTSLAKIIVFSIPLWYSVFQGYAGSPISGEQNIPEVKGLDFIENSGQWNPEVRYKTDLPGGVVFITDGGFVHNYVSQEDIERIERKMYSTFSGSNRIQKSHSS